MKRIFLFSKIYGKSFKNIGAWGHAPRQQTHAFQRGRHPPRQPEILSALVRVRDKTAPRESFLRNNRAGP
jgi:hypothetical protein